MGADDQWHRLVVSASHATDMALPQQIILDDVVIDKGVFLKELYPEVIAAGGIANAPLARGFWQIVWESACGEVCARYGCERRSCITSGSLGFPISVTMEDLYRILFFVGAEKGDALKETETKRLALWRSYAAFARSKNWPVDYNEMGYFSQRSEEKRRPIKFSPKACSYMWSCATRAWTEGWLLQPLREEPARMLPAKDEPFQVDLTNVKSPNMKSKGSMMGGPNGVVIGLMHLLPKRQTQSSLLRGWRSSAVTKK